MANAIGAALGTVGAMVDSIESLDLGEPREGEGEKETEERVKKARPIGILARQPERWCDIRGHQKGGQALRCTFTPRK